MRIFGWLGKMAYLCTRKTEISSSENNKISLQAKFRAFSSAGSEHLPYKQRVGGSNPSTPTLNFLVFWLGSLAQLNRAFDYGSKGCRFESCRSHKALGR